MHTKFTERLLANKPAEVLFIGDRFLDVSTDTTMIGYPEMTARMLSADLSRALNISACVFSTSAVAGCFSSAMAVRKASQKIKYHHAVVISLGYVDMMEGVKPEVFYASMESLVRRACAYNVLCVLERLQSVDGKLDMVVEQYNFVIDTLAEKYQALMVDCKFPNPAFSGVNRRGLYITNSAHEKAATCIAKVLADHIRG